MTLGEHFIFVDQLGNALPEWLQVPLQSQALRLARSFSALRDSARLQNLLDQIGQRVLHKIEGGNQIKNLTAYVGAAARNAALDALRNSKSDALGQLAAQTFHEGAFSSQHRDSAELKVTMNQITQILTTLEEQILIRFVVHGERHSEIAATLGLSPTAVRSRYSRSLERLRRRFQIAT